jgi:glycosyltransferase involved in cell wall biosynthesis
VASFISDRSKVQRIDDGFPSLRMDNDAGDARRAFADVNSDLRFDAGDFVVLIVSALVPQANLSTVAQSLAIIARERGDIRFWFVGEGTQRDALHAQLCELGVRNMAAMPGTFGHIDDLWQVAKLVIAPCVIDGLEHRLPTAIGAGIPLIAADLAGLRTWLAARPTDSTAGDCCFYPVDDAEFLARQILNAVSNYPQAVERAAQLRNRLCKLKPREHSIEQHQALFDKLLRAQAGNSPASVQEDSP